MNLIKVALRAVARARTPILTVALAYVIAVLVGALLAHAGNDSALGYRDKLVNQALAGDPSSIALEQGNRLGAALSDFGRNLVLGAVPNTVGAVSIVPAYLLAGYRGWIGGIVSVDGSHVSRLADPREGFYYVLTLVLQLIPYSLAGGAGVNVGLAALRPRPYYEGKKWLGLPREALLDMARIYLLIVPLFLIASLWEFLAV